MTSPDMLASDAYSLGSLALAAAVVGCVFGLLDFIWIGFVAKDLYFSTLQPIMAPSPRYVAMVLFYAVYVIALIYFVAAPFASLGIVRTAIQGALFGALAYAVYDLTNLSTLAAFTWKLAFIDIAWGAIASATASAAGAAILRVA